MELKAIAERTKRFLVKSPGPSRELAFPGERNLYRELAVRQLARYYSDERVLVSAYQAARGIINFNAAVAEARQSPEAWRAENLLTFMEEPTGIEKKAVASHAMLREGILSIVPHQDRIAVEREGFLRARQILREKLNQGEGINKEYQQAAIEMIRLLDARLAGDGQNDVSVPSSKLLPKA